MGGKITLLVFDNLSTSIGSHVAAERAARAGVAAIVGPKWSSHAIAAAKVAQAEKIPMISDGATNPKITKIGNYIFRACFTDDFQGHVMARFARRHMNAGTAVVFTDVTSDYSSTLSKIFRENFERSGGEVLLETRYKTEHNIFSKQIAQAKKASPDILFVPGHDEVRRIVRQALGAGITAVPLGGDGWASVSMSGNWRELKLGYYCTHWTEQSNSAQSVAFKKKYKKMDKFGVGMALIYDTMILLADAIRRAGSTDRAGIRDALAGTKSFKGVTGNISFDSDGNPVKSAVIMEIRNGQPGYFKKIDPQP